MKMLMKSLTLSVIAGLSMFVVSRAAEKPAAATTEELLIQAQKICPVTGAPLGSMGKPIKTASGEQTLYLCCKGCVGKPLPKERLSKVTANIRQAQGKCPVTGEMLPEDAASIVVDHRIVFVCCKECIEKVKADPAKYLAIVDKSLTEDLKTTK